MPKSEVNDRASASIDDLPVEIMPPTVEPTDLDELSFEELLAHFKDELSSISGSPKEQLLGVPFIITDLSFHVDDHERRYVFVQCVTVDSKRVNFTDGSSGIMKQLVEYWRMYRKTAGIKVPRGLRKSEYTVEVDGIVKPATTYYIA